MIDTKYLSDESKLSGGNAETIFFPTSTEEVSSFLQEIAQRGDAVTISAARTGITGGAVPFGGALISLEKMNRFLGLGFDTNAGKWYLRVQPAVVLTDIGRVLKGRAVKGLKALTPNALDDFAQEAKSFFYPVDPTELGASIGGTIATNASGARSFAYGATRRWIKAITVVFGAGERCTIERGNYLANEQGEISFPVGDKVQRLVIPSYVVPNVKNSAGIYAKPGMDLIDLFIGSEGILGVITEVEIWLTEQHDELSVIQFFDTEQQFLDFVETIRIQKDLALEFLECIDSNGLALIRKRQENDPAALDIPLLPRAEGGALLFDLLVGSDKIDTLSKVEELCRHIGVSPDQSWVAYSAKDKEKLRKFRHALPESVNEIIALRKHTYPELHKLSTDMSVCDEHLRTIYAYYREQLDQSKLHYVMFGHIGNNHIHINILPQNMDEQDKAKAVYHKLAEKVVSLGGSLSAEHGIGKMKRDYIEMMYGEEGINEMRRIKHFFDPKERCNKGNVIA